MEQTKRNRLKIFVKVLFFLLLSILFFTFYFFNQTKEFLKGSTTFTSRAEEVDHFDMPVLLLCFQPRYNLNSYLQRDDHSSLAEFLDCANHKLGEDVMIDFHTQWQKFHGQKKQQLVMGTNIFDDFYVNVSAVQTLTYGMCYVLESNLTFRPQQGFYISIQRKFEKEDIPDKVNLFMASPESWYGITTEAWPYHTLEKHTFEFNTSARIWMDMYVKKVTYQKGHSSIKNCLENHVSGYNCTHKCIPFFLSFLDHLPTCLTNEQTNCMYNTWAYADEFNIYTQYKQCLKPLTMTLYDANPVKLEGEVNPNNSVDLLFGYASNEMEIKEEALMIGTSSYIGSVGGSLGLFLGFSFFTHLSWCIDKLVDFCCKTTIIKESHSQVL